MQTNNEHLNRGDLLIGSNNEKYTVNPTFRIKKFSLPAYQK